MKKLTTLLVMLFFTAGMAFAQSNLATIDQVGDDHEATIEQIGYSNTSYVDQTDGGGSSVGDAFADILQQGDYNNVNLRQRAFFGFPDESVANITQIGNNNSVQGTSSSNAFYQNQPGGILTVYMEGDDNTLYSLRGEAQKNNNEFTLDIIGDLNNVGVAQEGGIGNVDISGNSNNVTLWQHARGGGFETANIDIAGNQNSVDVDQENGNNTATANVTGDFNTSTIIQN